jgi:L-fuculose-phosphate aldolase
MPTSPPDDVTQRHQLVQLAGQLVSLGLNHGSAGNLSVRHGQHHFLITPSAIPAAALGAPAIVGMTLDGQTTSPGKPSSEWRFHRDIYLAKPEVNAIVHVHSPHATALACLQQDLPAFHYMVALAGGDNIRCTPYAPFGSQALSDLAVQALAQRKACLLGNHGMIATGASLAAALDMTIEVESLCRQYLLARSAGTPVLLAPEQMQHALEQFKGYRPQE